MLKRGPRCGPASSMRSTTCGMTSPARWTRTRSPSRTSLRATSSRLWSVARLTVTPPISTGRIIATGVTTPVRPTLAMMRVDAGDLLARRELEGEGPARVARGGAQLFARRQVVELDDDAVDLEAEVVAAPPRSRGRRGRRRRCPRGASCTRSPQPRRASSASPGWSGGRRPRPSGGEDVVEVDVERTLRGELRVELAERSRRRRCAGWRKALSPPSSAAR